MSSCTQKDYIKIGQIISKALEEKQYIEKMAIETWKSKGTWCQVCLCLVCGVWCLFVFSSLYCVNVNGVDSRYLAEETCSCFHMGIEPISVLIANNIKWLLKSKLK